jgi:hypothetical protein
VLLHVKFTGTDREAGLDGHRRYSHMGRTKRADPGVPMFLSGSSGGCTRGALARLEHLRSDSVSAPAPRR